MCVPQALEWMVVQEFHRAQGHIGIDKLIQEVSRRFHLANPHKLKEIAHKLVQICPTCQACNPPNWQSKGPIEPTPIPPHIFTSIVMDIFSMPPIIHDGIPFDSMLVAADRHSGWVMAEPVQKVGLTARKVGTIMYHRWTELGCIPAHITSDKGPQFTGTWWKTMCQKLGIHHFYSQAYRPQGNGRAERAGKQVMTGVGNSKRKKGLIGLKDYQGSFNNSMTP